MRRRPQEAAAKLPRPQKVEDIDFTDDAAVEAALRRKRVAGRRLLVEFLIAFLFIAAIAAVLFYFLFGHNISFFVAGGRFR